MLALDQEAEDRLTETFAALANPTRRAILARLSQGEVGVSELARPFDMSLPAISRHIRVLERAGLVTQGQRAQFRPCSLDPRPLQAVAGWAEQYRSLWEDGFDRMDAYLQQLGTTPDPTTTDPIDPIDQKQATEDEPT